MKTPTTPTQKPPKGPIDFATVLETEKNHIGKPPSDAAALCISGGGIRSATFALGVLQGLADKGFLSCFDYLSTVSGGGYIGGWLSAWIHRRSHAKVMQDLKSSIHPEPPEIAHLRRYSNYLTPKLGLLSSDTWTLASIFVRNLLLIWLVLMPFLFAVLLLPRLLVCVAKAKPLHVETGALSASFAVLVAIILIVVALLPKHGSAAWQRILFFLAVFLLLAAAMLAPLGLRDSNAVNYWRARPAHPYLTWPNLGFAAAAIFLLYIATWRFFKTLARIIRFVNAFLLGGMLLAVELWFLIRNVVPILNADSLLFVCFAGPLFVLALVFSGYLVTGLTHFDLRDMHREWLASLGGWLLMYALVWSVSSVLVLFGPELFYSHLYHLYVQTLKIPQRISWIATYGSAAGAVASAIFAAMAGFGSGTTAGRRDAGGLSGKLTAALTVFVVLLVLLLARLADAVLAFAGAVPENLRDDTHRSVLVNTWGWPLAAITAALFAASLVLSRYISVNKFSLHAMYRNRLIRAYLGASNSARNPNPITGFDPADNLPLWKLRREKLQDSKQRPLHVINMALNLVGGDELAWQERKAESFTASAYHVGSEPPRHPLGYRDTAFYGGMTDGPTSLGTAVAISGAAANPNMGYVSSPALTFLMTLLNARLGWWLGNPGPAGEGSRFVYPSWNRSGPAYGLTFLLMEAFGLTNDRRRYVNLSDGGHFENLALYEMIRRKCLYIVVIDGGCDGKLTLDDLGNAVRKCRIDFGAKIDFDSTLTDLVLKRRRWATAKITYSPLGQGYLLYLKPLVFDPDRRDEPPDVRSYHDKHPEFPHESTVDQFFSESQFESYRQLGFHTVKNLNLTSLADIATLVTGLAPHGP